MLNIISEYITLYPIEIEIFRAKFSTSEQIDSEDVMEVIDDILPSLDRLSNDAYDDMREDIKELLSA
jgi:hypothetical protein